MKEDLLFELLEEKEEYSNLQYYLGKSQNSIIRLSINNIIDQINKKINQISNELLSVNHFKNK